MPHENVVLDLILAQLKELRDGQNDMQRDITDLKIGLATIEAKASSNAKWISGVGASIGTALGVAVHLVLKK
jgi:hypothetical protein